MQLFFDSNRNVTLKKVIISRIVLWQRKKIVFCYRIKSDIARENGMFQVLIKTILHLAMVAVIFGMQEIPIIRMRFHMLTE